MRRLKVVGGGLAGLVLGIALRRSGIPVRLVEAGQYPRHRVCGEFICGRGTAVLERLGLGAVLEGACRHRTVRWERSGGTGIAGSGEKSGGTGWTQELPEPATGLSRFLLDERLAKLFTGVKGSLETGCRYRGGPEEGVIFCNGRAVSHSVWTGLKFHVRAWEGMADLEMHLGAGLYVGVSGVEDGRANVCALVRRDRLGKGPRKELLLRALERAGLGELAGRVEAAGIDPASHAAVAGVRFGEPPRHADGCMRLGDAYSVMPPFTGNGMSLALEAAELAVEPLVGYAQGCCDWDAVCREVHRRCDRRFRFRLAAARWLHPFLFGGRNQAMLWQLARWRLLPVGLLYRVTH